MVASLIQELTNLRRLLARGGEQDPEIVERHTVLHEAVLLAQARPARSTTGQCCVVVRLRDGERVLETSPVSATDCHFTVPFEGSLSEGDEPILLIWVRPGPPTVAVRSKVMAVEEETLRLGTTGIPRAERLAILEAIAVDVSRAGECASGC